MPRKTVKLPFLIQAKLEELARRRKLRGFSSASGIPRRTLYRARIKGEIWAKHYAALVEALSGLPELEPDVLAHHAVNLGATANELFRVMQDPLRTGRKIYEAIIDSRLLRASLGRFRVLPMLLSGAVDFDDYSWEAFQAELKEILPQLDSISCREARRATQRLRNALRRASRRGRGKILGNPFELASLAAVIPFERLAEIALGRGVSLDELLALSELLFTPPHALAVLTPEGERLFSLTLARINEALRGTKYRDERKRLEAQREDLQRLREVLNLKI